MTGSFVLTQGAGQKLEFALNRNGCEADVVEWLSAGGNLLKVRMLVSGVAEVVVKPLTEAVAGVAQSIANAIVRTAKVNLSLSGKQAIKATGRAQYLTDAVVAEMPRVGTSSEVTLHYVNPGIDLKPKQLDEWVEKNYPGYRLADPFELAADQEVDPTFADTHPCGTQWWDKNGNPCCAVFFRWFGERGVRVNQDGDAWNGFWWFPLVCK